MRIDVYKRGMTALQFRLSNPNLIFKASSQFKDSIKVSTINYRRGVHRWHFAKETTIACVSPLFWRCLPSPPPGPSSSMARSGMRQTVCREAVQTQTATWARDWSGHEVSGTVAVAFACTLSKAVLTRMACRVRAGRKSWDRTWGALKWLAKCAGAIWVAQWWRIRNKHQFHWLELLARSVGSVRVVQSAIYV